MSSSAIDGPVPTWKNFPFFDIVPVTDIHDNSSTPEVFKNTPEISTVASSSAGVLVADIYGSIHALSKDFEATNSWVAHVGGRVIHMLDRKGILVTIGEEESSPSPLLKIWDLGKTDKKTGAPVLLRSAKIQHGNRPHPVSTIALSATLSHLAVGLADGTVLLYRQLDQYLSPSGSVTSLPKARIIHESPTEPIMGLGFREPGAGDEAPIVHLFIVTTNRVLCYKTSGRSIGGGGQPVEVDEKGAALGCAVMDWRARDMIIARTEAIYICGPEGRGSSYAYEGPKSSVHTHLNYLIIISPPFYPSAATSSATVRNFVARSQIPDRTDVSKVTVFDLENKLVAYSGTVVEGVRAIVSEWGYIFVLANDGKLSRLQEKPTPEKLEMLYRKHLFTTALSLAKTQGLEASSVADIHRQYGDHLYTKGDYDGAMQQYVKTIGFLQPSYVIRKFLDAQRIHNLVTYLQDLHRRGLANSDHTTLLLNTYTKLKDVARLNEFIKAESKPSADDGDEGSLSDEPPFDLETAIRVCRQAGYFEHASYLAKKYRRHEDYLRIQVEDAGNYKDALAYVRKLDPNATEFSLARYGRIMLANLPDETTQLLIDICTRSSSDDSSGADSAPATTSKGTFSGPSYLSYLRGAPAMATASSSDSANLPTPSTATAKPSSEGTLQLSGPSLSAGATGVAAVAPVPKRSQTASSHDTSSPSADSPVVATGPSRPRAEKRPSPRLYFAHFVDNLDKFVVFLEAVALRLWGQSVNESDAKADRDSLPVPVDEEADKQDQIAVWNTLLELYLTLSKDDDDALRAKAMRVLESTSIPSDPTHALILCSARDFTPGLVLLWERLDMYEDVLRFWMDRARGAADSDPSAAADASHRVVQYLDAYGTQHQHLYALVLRFLTSSPELLTRHAEDVGRILEHVEQEKIMPPLGVVKVLSRNDVTSVGLVKQWLLARIKEAKDEMHTDRQLIDSYREETTAKLKQVEELSDSNNPRVFHVTRCSACSAQLDLPSMHFMCNHSYHQRCVADNETECPKCARNHGMIREIRRNNERLAGQHELFLSEVREGGFAAVAAGFSRGLMRMPRLGEASTVS